MGNLRFRFSDMMPNAWFYKLKYMAAAAADHRTTPSQPRRSGRKLQSSKPCQPNDHHSHSRKSYYFTRDLNSTHQKLLDSPSKLQPISSPRRRKSSNQRPNRRTTATGPRPSPELVPSVSAGCSCRANWAKPDSPSAADVKYSASVSETDSDSLPTEIRSDCSLVTDSFDKMVSSWSSNSCSCPRESVDSGGNDIVLDVDKPARQVFDEMLDRNLAPILTKTASFDDRIEGIRRKETGAEEPTRKQRSNSLIKKQSCANSPGIKLRVKSPRIGYMRVQGSGRNSASSSSTKSSSSSSSTSRSSTTTTSSTSGRVSGCMAVVKCSSDPEMDFMESMVEMIVENKISGSKELEDLLACYLCLNSDEYHDVIIKVFREIWFDYLNNSSRSK